VVEFEGEGAEVSGLAWSDCCLATTTIKACPCGATAARVIKAITCNENKKSSITPTQYRIIAPKVEIAAAAAGAAQTVEYDVGSLDAQEIPQCATVGAPLICQLRACQPAPHLPRRTGCLFGRDT
jgi:hypothetical protein